MKKKVLGIGFAALLALGGVACGNTDASDVDIDEPKFKGDAVPSDYSAQAPDLIRVYQNVDNHPTIVMVCIEGIAFRTLSTSHDGGFEGAAARVPEWDALCDV